ncbi:MAG: sensor histidine kinase [Lachnospirales bacterium]
MIRKLKWQFVLVNVLLICLVVLPTFSYMHISLKNDMYKDSVEAIEKGLKEFAQEGSSLMDDRLKYRPFEPKIDPPDDTGGHSYFNTFFVRIDSDQIVEEVYTRTNFIIDDETINEILKLVISSGETNGHLDSLNLRYMVLDTVSYTGEHYRTIGFADTSYEDKMLQDQLQNLIIVGIVIIVGVFLISIFLSNLVIKPIEKSWKQQKQFVSDVSHELKTPTSIILANTSILSMNDELTEDKKWVDYIDIEARRMKKLIEDLLFLSKSDYNVNDEVLSNCSLNNIVMESILPFEAIVFEDERNLKFDINVSSDENDNIEVLCDQNQLKQLVAIFLDNAIKYAIEDSVINVSLTKEANKGILEFNNMTEYIDKDELSKIFNRFHKVDKARTRQDSSYGLGLSIAKEIIHKHKGKVNVVCDKDKGITFKIQFPCSKSK